MSAPDDDPMPDHVLRDALALRYAHLAPEAHEKVITSWRRRASGDGG
ncbi:hypothetical protein [Streptosporangium sp. NPDC004631]